MPAPASGFVWCRVQAALCTLKKCARRRKRAAFWGGAALP